MFIAISLAFPAEVVQEFCNSLQLFITVSVLLVRFCWSVGCIFYVNCVIVDRQRCTTMRSATSLPVTPVNIEVFSCTILQLLTTNSMLGNYRCKLSWRDSSLHQEWTGNRCQSVLEDTNFLHREFNVECLSCSRCSPLFIVFYTVFSCMQCHATVKWYSPSFNITEDENFVSKLNEFFYEW